SDVVMTLKLGLNHSDFVLSELCAMLLNRNLLKIKFTSKPTSAAKIKKRIDKLCATHSLNENEAAYFVFSGSVSNTAYSIEKPIKIWSKNNKIVEFTRVGNEDSFKALNKKSTKFYYCYPKL
ncbi:MAG: phosphohydrolase, partial [Nonlabens sp.]